ncbi:MAG: tetratricopeptide repeat protein [Acidobacteria bacterium]|nr:tetratricopeptide repeat protein [Acidobacteriota bacterium]
MRERLLLLAGAAAAFGASLGSGFHFDDYDIFADPTLGSAGGWIQVWAPRQTRPLTFFTFWLNRQLGGGDALGYHLFNLVFHLAAVALAYECLRRLVTPRAAFIGAAVFAIHPIQAEAVNYVWARGIVLASLLCLAALWYWIEGRPWLAVLWFLLALLAKEEVAAFPLLLAWLDWRESAPRARRRWLPVAAMLALSLCAGARVVWATMVTPGAPAGLQAGISPLQYLLVQGGSLLRYLQLLLFPYGFSVDPRVSTALWPSLGAWVIVLGALVLVMLYAPRGIATWIAGGMLLLLPSSSIFPAADLAVDRRMYLPMFAFAAAAGLALEHVRPAPVLAVLGVMLAGVSLERTIVWQSDRALWREAMERAPGKVRPKIQLARALPAAEALELLNRARLDAPNDPVIAAEIGKTLLSEGQADAALEEFGRALALDPSNARYMNDRGVALAALGQTEAARADFVRALYFDPSLREARDNLNKLPAPQ